MNFVRLVLIFSLSLFLSKATAQRFTHYNIENGLSDNQVQCILQDRKGFMWIGTNDGLNRFDGNEFKIFKCRPDNNQTVSGNNIRQIIEDPVSGLLWIGTSDGGICSYDPVKSKFTRYPLVKNNTPYPNIRSMSLNKSGKLWIAYDQVGVHTFDTRRYTFDIPNQISSTISNRVYTLTCKSDSSVYISPISYGCYILKDKEVKQTPFKGDRKLFPGHTMNILFEDNKHNIWGGAWDNSLYRIENDATLTRFPLGDSLPDYSGNEIFSIAEFNNETLWLGTRFDGLYSIHLPSGQIKKLGNNPDETSNIHGKTIFSLYRDREKRIWCGSDQGLHVYDPLLNQFEVLKLPDASAKIHDFIHDDFNNLLIGTDKGIFVMNEKTGSVYLKTYDYENEPIQFTKFFRDKRGRIYAGTNKTLFIINSDNHSIKTFDDFNTEYFKGFNPIVSSRVNAIGEATIKGRDYIIASIFGHGNIFFDSETLKGDFVNPSSDKSPECFVRRYYRDPDNNFWILGASKGLGKFQDISMKVLIENGIYKGYQIPVKAYNNEVSDDIRISDVTDMIRYNDSTYFISTNGSGLFRFYPHRNQSQFEYIPSEISTMQGFAKDNNGILWILSSRGILRFDPDKNSFSLYTASSGIPSQGLKPYWYENKTTGTLYAASQGYFIRFQPAKYQTNTSIPEILLTHLKVLDRNADSLITQNGFELNHDQNMISIQYAALNFTSPEKNRYTYFMEGLDHEWHAATAGNKINFTGIPPGPYRLFVRASNNDGVWSEPVKLLEFNILPPWYNTGWFYVSCIITVAGVFYIIYRYRVNQLLKIQMVRNKIARDLHDDIGSTLGSISLFSEVASRKLNANENSETSEVLKKIGESSREMLENIGDIVWVVNPSQDSVENLVQRMQNFAVPLFATRNIRIRFHVTGNASQVKMTMEQRKNIFLIFKEAVHNTLKYSDCKTVEVYLSSEGKNITFRFRDDGKGFDTANVKAYNGNGLENIRQRAKAINGKAEITSEVYKGTDIQVNFNLKTISA